jgi:hypothetical protein
MCLFTSSLSFLLQLINKPELVTTNSVKRCRVLIQLSSLEMVEGKPAKGVRQLPSRERGVGSSLSTLIYSNKLGGIFFIDLP